MTEEDSGYAGPPPLLTQRPVAAWAFAGLGALFLVVVVLVVRGGTLHAPRAIQSSSEAAEWVNKLPSDVAIHIDRGVDPCNDFYAFSCGAWQRQVEIPEDRASMFLSFSAVSDENEKVLKQLMQQGMATGKPRRTRCTHQQSGLTLPDPQYYLDKKQFDSISDAFHAYVVELFLLAGWGSGEAASRASSVIGFEQTLAPLFVPKEDLQDPVASYNRMSVAQAAEKYPLVFAKFVNGTGLLKNLTARNADVIVETPAFFERVQTLVGGDSAALDTLKAVLTYQYISAYAGVLSEPFVQASFSFFARTLRGQKTRAPRWKVCLQRVTDNFPDLVGKYYALLRFDQASEQLASQLVTQLQVSLEKNLGRVDWLDGPTRRAALEKLSNMTNLIGHSTRSEHFPFELRSDASLAENMQVVKQHQFERVVGRIGGPVDRNKWAMTSAAVNAYYQPTANQIVFPAGILQPPFFARGRHPARNFGAIGSVIGHELTHGFDSSGRYYAGDGNLKDWWMTSGADNDKVLGHVNGNFTLSENIADNGGVKLSFAAYQTFIEEHAQQLSKMSESDATEFSAPLSQTERDLSTSAADKLFFISFAQAFCAKTSDASTTQRLATDPHSPERWRINGVASNSLDFARVFSCPADSPMNPKTKCQLW
ncbi:hypothetical protein PRIC1_006355 [Phytophthora ramorum]